MVLDASALLELVRRMEDDAQHLSGALLELHGLFRVVAPDILGYELANVLSSERHLEVDDDTVRDRLLRLLLADVRLVGLDLEDVRRILHIARQEGLSAYDAAYLELASRDDRTPLVTEDRRLLAAADSMLGAGRAFRVGALGQGGSPYREPFTI